MAEQFRALHIPGRALMLPTSGGDESAGTSGMPGRTWDADDPPERIVTTWQSYAAHLGPQVQRLAAISARA